MSCFFVAAKSTIQLKHIELKKNPYRLEIGLDEKPPCKIITIGPKEYLIALNNVKAQQPLRVEGNAKPLIVHIGVDRPSDQVLTVVVNTRRDVGSLYSHWDAARKTLVVSFAKPLAVSSPETASRPIPSRFQPRRKVKAEQFKKNYQKAPQVAPATDTAESGPPEKTNFSGTIGDFWLEINDDACLNQVSLLEGLQDYHSGQWQSAFDKFSDYIRRHPSDECLEKAYYMKAFSLYQNVVENKTRQLEAIDFLQETVNRFPQSDYLPYAYVAMGKTYRDLNNAVQAKAHFKLAVEQFPDYAGKPEALFELGRIYSSMNHHKEAISLYKEIVSEFPRSQLMLPASIELAHAMYKDKNYREMLKMLTPLYESNPRMMYESPDLLLYIGNAQYHTGGIEKARATLSRALNCFPTIESKDEVLSRIADSYIEQRQPQKAVKIYEYIVENYPETAGYVTGLIRLAQFSTNEEEKTRLYRKVIDQFPSHSLARQAMIRLAELYNKNGEFEKSLPVLEKILKNPSDLFKSEALVLMEDAYLALFEKMMQQGDYPHIMIRYEEKKAILDRLGNPDILAIIGKAYASADLYPQALDLLTRAYERIGGKKQRPDLIYALGVSMQETQQPDKALRMFDHLTRDFPNDADIKDVHHRSGLIYVGKKEYQKAINHFKIARAQAPNPSGGQFENALIMLDEAGACRMAGNLTNAANLLIKAINLLAAETGNHADLIAVAYRRLGDVHTDLQDYLKAVDAFTMAIKFFKDKNKIPEITFAIAESYNKARQPDKALGYYNQVIDTDAPLWAKLARERLREINLNKKLQNRNLGLSL